MIAEVPTSQITGWPALGKPKQIGLVPKRPSVAPWGATHGEALEAITLSILGGLVGIALGVGVSNTLTQTLGWPTEITTTSIVLAFGFAATVGVFFGYYPARKAASLDPIDALRYE